MRWGRGGRCGDLPEAVGRLGRPAAGGGLPRNPAVVRWRLLRSPPRPVGRPLRAGAKRAGGETGRPAAVF